MKQRIEYVLKHNMIIQRLYTVIMSFVFRFLGLFIRTDSEAILFVSFMGLNFNDNPRVIYEYIKSHNEYSRFKCIWAFEHPEKYPEIESVKIDTFAYFIYALKAKYWVTNTNIERGLRFKKKGTVYLNTWHGVTLKHIGNDCPGRKDFDFGNVDFLVVSGSYDEKVFKTAFKARDESYLRCGMPRNEILWKVTNEDVLRIRKKLGIQEDKKIILYAPTWRESTDGGKSYAIKPPIHFKEWEKILGKDYIVLFRAHHQTNKILGVEYNSFVRNYSDYPDVNDLMVVADILITDYSAIAFDFSILHKPILIYAYDYEDYLIERGTYFDIDKTYPNKSCKDENELLERVISLDYEQECENTKVFSEKFIQYGIGATEACVLSMFTNSDC